MYGPTDCGMIVCLNPRLEQPYHATYQSPKTNVNYEGMPRGRATNADRLPMRTRRQCGHATNAVMPAANAYTLPMRARRQCRYVTDTGTPQMQTRCWWGGHAAGEDAVPIRTHRHYLTGIKHLVRLQQQQMVHTVSQCCSLTVYLFYVIRASLMLQKKDLDGRTGLGPRHLIQQSSPVGPRFRIHQFGLGSVLALL